MKITLDNSDLAAVLGTFCPSLIAFDHGKFSLVLKGKKIVLGETSLALNSQVAYGNINGVVDLQLNKDGAAVNFILK